MATKSINVNNESSVNAIANKGNDEAKSMINFIKVYESQFKKALPSVITPERFVRVAQTAITRNPELAMCTPDSFVGALLCAAQLGLEPNTVLGQAYLIPYYNSKNRCKEVQFQVGYKGIIELAHRTGELKSIEAHIVREGDEFLYELGLEPKLMHKPALDGRGDILWVYAVYHLANGGYGFEVMSKADIDRHKDTYSKTSYVWRDNWEEMAKKTVIKRVLKYAPMASEFHRAMAEENTTMNFKTDGEEVFVVQDESTINPDKIVDMGEEDIKVE